MQKEYKSINKSVRKKDAMQLLTGKPVYTDDVTPSDALVVKILRSPHANAIVQGRCAEESFCDCRSDLS